MCTTGISGRPHQDSRPSGGGEALLRCASPRRDEAFQVLTQTKEGSFPSLLAPKFTNSMILKSGLNSFGAFFGTPCKVKHQLRRALGFKPLIQRAAPRGEALGPSKARQEKEGKKKEVREHKYPVHKLNTLPLNNLLHRADLHPCRNYLLNH